ncbi:DNA polymerase [Clostridium neonatale]|uniref:DNA polymerase n=1 Tax=Clostridium neonatale TaxID=137838 RepID=UPI002936EDF2|nr:DNA polymerase [Clostridium neonatale]
MDGAKTGRITCSNPNLQGFPNGIKEFFIPEEGNVFVICDYNQIELRVLAELAGEKNMIKAFEEGKDIHCETAALILQKNKNLIDNAERKLGKKVNFSMIYGVSTYGLTKILNKEGISVTQSQADYIRTLFYRSYPNIFKLHNILLTADVIKSIGGRCWDYIPKGDVKRLNLPIQASAAEGFKEALALLVESLTEYPEWSLVNVIHDEILLEVPIDEAEKAKEILQKSMIQGMKTILKIVPVIVDIKIQDNWKK